MRMQQQPPGSNPGAQDHPSTQPRPRRTITTRECSAGSLSPGSGPQTCQGGNHSPSVQVRKLKPRICSRLLSPGSHQGDLSTARMPRYSRLTIKDTGHTECPPCASTQHWRAGGKGVSKPEVIRPTPHDAFLHGQLWWGNRPGESTLSAHLSTSATPSTSRR